jgi:hypothetical protein
MPRGSMLLPALMGRVMTERVTREREILASLNHPDSARLIDAENPATLHRHGGLERADETSAICSSMWAIAQRQGNVRPTIRPHPGFERRPQVTDVYIYYFMVRDRSTGESRLSTRPATLKAIKGKGKPLMESQLVVDHTEVDDDGFFIATDGNDSRGINDIAAQIRSVELRAASRDSEALKLNEATEGKDKYMLSLESRELRGQARLLKTQRIDLQADEPGRVNESPDVVIQFGWHPTPE